MNDPGNPNRPYPPASNVVSVLQRLRSRNLPETVDSEYLRDAGVPEGSIGRTMFAMRFLGLVNVDAPSAVLRSIATSTDEEYKEALRNLLHDRYQDVFAVVDPSQDDMNRIINVFRRYTPASQRERMVRFFLGMCREAGIPVLDVPATRKSGRAGLRRTGPRAAAPTTGGAAGTEAVPEKAQSRIPAALELLLRSLPPEGTPLPEIRREQWLRMARETLTFVYPTGETAEPESGTGPNCEEGS